MGKHAGSPLPFMGRRSPPMFENILFDVILFKLVLLDILIKYTFLTLGIQPEKIFLIKK
jgi:hypothetical protein